MKKVPLSLLSALLAFPAAALADEGAVDYVCTKPEGYVKLSFPAGAGTYYLGNPMEAKAIWRGKVSSVAATQLTLDNPVLAENELTDAPYYYLRFITGNQRGRHCLILDVEGAVVEVDTEDGQNVSVPLNEVDWAVAQDDIVEIARADTVTSLILRPDDPTAFLRKGTSSMNSDVVSFWNGVSWYSYYYHSTENQWKSGVSGTPAITELLLPDRAWGITRRAISSAVDVVFTGTVPEQRTLTRHEGSVGVVSSFNRFPVNQTMSNFAYGEEGEWVRHDTTAGFADRVVLHNGVSWETFWKKKTSDIWVKLGDTVTDRSAEVVEVGRGMRLIKRAVASGKQFFLSQEMPYSNPRL
ncbi:MAG: hypothetical protein LBR12_01465 [Opitutaceae bacterium]|jgi:hypothetical protein|nr:hypothetical protein [Opitutaceae bacterium]